MANEALIHVVDDDKAIRDSLAFLLETMGFRAELFDSATAFLEASACHRVDCLITDIRMPGLGGIELLRRLRADGRRFPVIVMTGHGEVSLAVEAMKLGAFDFLEKPFDDEVLIATVRAALRHGASIAQADRHAHDIARRVESLTPRERQVLDGLVEGHSNKAIGRHLAISPRTVEVYRANVMTKMGASSVSELVRFIIRARYPG